MNTEQIGELKLFSIPVLFQACKHRDYRSNAIMKAEAVATVFTKEGISHLNLLSRFTTQPEEFEVKIKELSAEGLEFGKTNFQRWLLNMDRWKEPPTLSKYIASLEAQWTKFKKKGQAKGVRPLIVNKTA